MYCSRTETTQRIGTSKLIEGERDWETMKTKLSKKFWWTLVIFGLMGQIAWVVENMYFNVFVYKMFHASAAEISLMVGASAVAATVTTLLVGALSDQCGKRKVFICAGYILWGFTILAFSLVRMDILQSFVSDVTAAASLGVSIVIVLDCVMTFFGSSANDACFNAWLTDTGDETNRGQIEGVNSMMPLVAILVVFGGFMSLDLEKSSSWNAIFWIIGGIVIIIGILGIFLIEERPIVKNSDGSYFKDIFYGFRPSIIRSNVVLYLTLVAFALFGISIQTFMPYLILYYEQTLHIDNYVLIMAPAIIIAAAITAFYGRLFDQKGFLKSVVPSLLSLGIGYLLLFFFQQTILVFLGSLCMMTGYLTGMAVFGAMIREYTPKEKTGLFQGLRIFSQVFIPGIIGPAIGATVLKDADVIVNTDGTTSFLPEADIFIAAFAIIVVVFGFLFVMTKKRVYKAK